MPSSTVVIVTGASRGIGHAIVAAYLSRPNHTVIGSVRKTDTPRTEDLKNLPVATGSRLLLVSIESTSTSDPKRAVEDMEAAGIAHIDIVVSNAGISPAPAPLDLADPEDLIQAFKVNAVASVLLFQAANRLLSKSEAPKWVSISSRVGSIGQAASFYQYASAYGMSKAAQDWFTATLHHSYESLTAFAVHPGFVSTDMGVAAAKGAGIDMPATTAKESAAKLLEVIDSAQREREGAKLIDIMTHEEISW
ncbi:NAD(P)-binding protein [Pseudovirgaria hyperparasitica]|uniref:NAD(P)-binding protein n=1 Tax=Pseudovirgaria hyperparasitica TaxID=470096 RepID=A0A6A6VXF6_9PEZI|nr:NAD(P)-binding protein [Pseudovirgaria hyperparasitica]KAF2754519.1 NAD(P)-binding protein [Pseudovirgaria hyperparasitica]